MLYTNSENHFTPIMVDQTETGDETEGTPEYPQEGDDGEISFGGACTENYHPIHLEETSALDHDRGQEL